MTLQLLHSEFPYIWVKFYFLFYQCGYPTIQFMYFLTFLDHSKVNRKCHSVVINEKMRNYCAFELYFKSVIVVYRKSTKFRVYENPGIQ